MSHPIVDSLGRTIEPREELAALELAGHLVTEGLHLYQTMRPLADAPSLGMDGDNDENGFAIHGQGLDLLVGIGLEIAGHRVQRLDVDRTGADVGFEARRFLSGQQMEVIGDSLAECRCHHKRHE